MSIEAIAEMWCRLFGYGSCFYVPTEMAVVLILTAVLAVFAVVAVLFGLLQKLMS
jgi:hypothetical protein